LTHATPRGRGDTGDEIDNGLSLRVVGLEELGGVFFCRSSNLTNHDDSVGLFVLEEDGEGVNEVCTSEGITTDSVDVLVGGCLRRAFESLDTR
jgi:hypothetical protein